MSGEFNVACGYDGYVDAMIQMYGIYEFQKMIQDREVAPNPKYELLIKQHRFDVLANRVEHYFTNK